MIDALFVWLLGPMTSLVLGISVVIAVLAVAIVKGIAWLESV